MNILKGLYKALVPESIRLLVYAKKIAAVEEAKKQHVLQFYKENPSSDSEINEALTFLLENPISALPYAFYKAYTHKEIEVHKDPDNSLPYVIHGSDKLYFKKSWKADDVKRSYRMLLAEQDASSPHRYLTADYQIDENSIVVDVGAAEGIFALNEMHKISHLYLIETDPEWIEALTFTYSKWLGKITIIPKYVSNKDDAQNVKLDTYFAKHSNIDFLKIDVDGAEQELLYGAAKVISDKAKKVVICTYHKSNDNRDFTSYFTEEGYNVHNSEKYLLFFHDVNFDPPYFRRALLKTKK